MGKYTDTKGRCDCLNSPFRQQGSLGLVMAACFDGNCSLPNVYVDKAIKVVAASGTSCTGTCSSIQLCFSETCIQNQDSIALTCPGYSAVQFYCDNGACTQCDDSGNCDGGKDLYATLAECNNSCGSSGGGDGPISSGSSSWVLGVIVALVVLIAFYFIFQFLKK